MARWLLLALVVALCVPAPAAAKKPKRCANGYVGLTFDDGPSRSTAGLLDALARHDLRATMFNIGVRAQARPDDVIRQVDAGMWFGNHSFTHPDLTRLEPPAIAAEIDGAQTALAALTGKAPKLFRPPGMLTDDVVRDETRRAGLTEVLATVDSRDYTGASVKEIVKAVRTAKPGGIVLMHDYVRNTTLAIPRIARALAARRLCPGRIRRTKRDVFTPNGELVFNAVAVKP